MVTFIKFAAVAATVSSMAFHAGAQVRYADALARVVAAAPNAGENPLVAAAMETEGFANTVSEMEPAQVVNVLDGQLARIRALRLPEGAFHDDFAVLQAGREKQILEALSQDNPEMTKKAYLQTLRSESSALRARAQLVSKL
jgi:hypothetical protein